MVHGWALGPVHLGPVHSGCTAKFSHSHAVGEGSAQALPGVAPAGPFEGCHQLLDSAQSSQAQKLQVVDVSLPAWPHCQWHSLLWPAASVAEPCACWWGVLDGSGGPRVTLTACLAMLVTRL
jgi:hypothetical protein